MLLDDFFSEYLKNLMLSEKGRIETFKHWPFDEKAACNVNQMAEAGFFWCGNEAEKDTVSCFVCEKYLDGWEASDNPWQEHSKHAPQCSYVKLCKSENQATVEEFLTLFVNVVTNHINKKLNQAKKKCRSTVDKEMEKFMKI